MSKTNNFIFTGLTIVAWIIFVGLCIEAGALVVNFFFGFYEPEFIQNLYQKLDLSEIYHHNKPAFFGIYSFILFIAILKAHMFYVVILLLTKLDLEKPFNSHVAQQIKNLSYYTFSIGMISYLARETTRKLDLGGIEITSLNQFWADAQAYILMAAIFYVIATIFSKGVDLQNENDLTV